MSPGCAWVGWREPTLTFPKARPLRPVVAAQMVGRPSPILPPSLRPLPARDPVLGPHVEVRLSCVETCLKEVTPLPDLCPVP